MDSPRSIWINFHRSVAINRDRAKGDAGRHRYIPKLSGGGAVRWVLVLLGIVGVAMQVTAPTPDAPAVIVQ